MQYCSTHLSPMATSSAVSARQDGCSFVGLVVDIRRTDRFDYDASQCIVFGINSQGTHWSDFIKEELKTSLQTSSCKKTLEFFLPVLGIFTLENTLSPNFSNTNYQCQKDHFCTLALRIWALNFAWWCRGKTSRLSEQLSKVGFDDA